MVLNYFDILDLGETLSQLGIKEAPCGLLYHIAL
jgi:hypothetical protein